MVCLLSNGGCYYTFFDYLLFYKKNSKFGYGLFSIREDEDAAVVLGVNTKKFKNIAFAISAFFPGLVGAIFFFLRQEILNLKMHSTLLNP